MPLEAILKEKMCQRIDYISLRRSKEELGLNDLKIEDMLYPKSLRDRTTFVHSEERSFSIFPKEDNP
jgi:hypothetical protein